MSRLIQVKNRSNGMVVYNLPERNVRREFTPREIKKIEYDELVALTGIAGGRELMYNFLYIEDKEVLRDVLNIQEEPEYWITEEQLPEWMQKCSLDEFKDGIDFMPVGMIDLIKKYAVELPINDVAKRKAILDMLDFNVDKAIEINEASVAEEETTENTVSNSKRRSNASTATSMNKPKITVINK